jgi:hypothetical protein
MNIFGNILQCQGVAANAGRDRLACFRPFLARRGRTLLILKTLFITVIAALAISTATAKAQSRSEEALFWQLTTNEVPSVSTSALNRVLKTPENFTAVILYAAGGLAFREKRLEDAGFLFYVAQLRRRYDNALFPPRGTGGNSPMLALGAMNQELGAVINPAMMAEPKVYAKALDRVKSWKPNVLPNYDPGWEYSKKGSQKQVEEAFAETRKDFMEHMNGLCTLLLDDAYFRAFKTAQDYNLKMNNDTNRPSKEMNDAAIHTMQRIEKEKGIEGITSVMSK